MKQGKRPVRKEKELLKSRRLNAKNWLVERCLKSSVIFLHKESGNLKEIFIKKGKMLVEKNNESTKLLQRKIRYMCAVEGEMEFYVLRPLFTDDVNVQAVVMTFQDVYDNSFSMKVVQRDYIKRLFGGLKRI